MLESILAFLNTTAFAYLTAGNVLMLGIALVLLYLGVFRGFEPLLLVPIAFGAFFANLPGNADGVSLMLMEPKQVGSVLEPGGLYYYLREGINKEIFPPLIFLGVGALTDFGPLIAAPRTLLLGAAAQLGVYITFIGAHYLGFTNAEAMSIGIIGGADGPTAIFTANKLAPHLLGAIAVAAYSYMALVPLIQPPIMRMLTTAKERKISMKTLRPVSKIERLIFPLVVSFFCVMMVPAAASLIGMLMLGNFFRECGVTERLSHAAQNEIINIITIFLGTSVGITMSANNFLRWETIKIVVLGCIAFAFSTAGGVLMAKFMNLFSSKDPINPLIGSAGVSAVPMAARVSHNVGQEYDRQNYLLMHAMGPNVAGVIGTAVAAGYFLALQGH
jgi:oxaloacetate decarboxylase beta subunit